MRWIRVEVAIGDSKMLGHLADALGVSITEAVGFHVQVWAKLPEHAPDGALGNQSVLNATIERWAGWRGKPGVFAKAYRDTCCDGNGYALDWERVNGAAMRESAATVERVRKLRADRRTAAVTAPDETQSVPRTVRRIKGVTHASNGNGTEPTAKSTTAANTDLSEREPLPQKRVENSVEDVEYGEPSAIVTRFMVRFYRSSTPARRTDIARQMVGTIIHKGVTYKNEVVKAVDEQHLDDACLEVMEDPPRDPNAAWVFVLERLKSSYLGVLSARAKQLAEPVPAPRVPAGMTGDAPIGATPLRAAIAGVLDGLEVSRGTFPEDGADDAIRS